MTRKHLRPVVVTCIGEGNDDACAGAGGEATLAGVDICNSERAGVFVLHEMSACTLDTCRVTDNAWHGAVDECLQCGEMIAVWMSVFSVEK